MDLDPTFCFWLGSQYASLHEFKKVAARRCLLFYTSSHFLELTRTTMASPIPVQEPQASPTTATVQGTNTAASIANPCPEKGSATEAHVEPEDLKPFPDSVPDLDAQHGIQKIEAVTLSWSKASLAALLIK